MNENIFLFNKKVEIKRAEFIEKYNCFPRYIKLPFELLIDIESYKDDLLPAIITDARTGLKTYHGLYLCPTHSIGTIDEIEVF